jgi:hypothetical protein
MNNKIVSATAVACAQPVTHRNLQPPTFKLALDVLPLNYTRVRAVRRGCCNREERLKVSAGK